MSSQINLPPEIWDIIVNHINLSGRERILKDKENILNEREDCLNELSVNIEDQLHNIENIINILNSVNSDQTKMINYMEMKYNEISEYNNIAIELNNLIDEENKYFHSSS